MKEELKENQDFVVFEGAYQGTTNVRTLKLLYSIKKNKFISPFKTHGDRVSGDIEYRIFPGLYIVFAVWKQRERFEFRLSLLKVTKETTDTVKSVTMLFSNNEYVNKSRVAYDFVDSLPGYHFVRHEGLFKKQYTEEDTSLLMKFLQEYDGKEFSEEGEME